MIHDIDEAVRSIIQREVIGKQKGLEVEFDAPTAEWSSRRNSPTIDAYLYDITEDPKRRQLTFENQRDPNTRIVQGRALPARRYQLSYLLTAWTQRPEDEHRLLSGLISAFLKYPVLPPDLLPDELRAMDIIIPVTIAHPRPEARRAFDVWSSLGGELKPSLDLVIVTPLAAPTEVTAGPPVLEDPRFTWFGDDLVEERTAAGSRAAAGRVQRRADATETVYAGKPRKGKKKAPAGSFGDGRAGRALVMSTDPEAVRRGEISDEGDSTDA